MKKFKRRYPTLESLLIKEEDYDKAGRQSLSGEKTTGIADISADELNNGSENFMRWLLDHADKSNEVKTNEDGSFNSAETLKVVKRIYSREFNNIVSCHKKLNTEISKKGGEAFDYEVLKTLIHELYSSDKTAWSFNSNDIEKYGWKSEVGDKMSEGDCEIPEEEEEKEEEKEEETETNESLSRGALYRKHYYGRY